MGDIAKIVLSEIRIRECEMDIYMISGMAPPMFAFATFMHSISCHEVSWVGVVLCMAFAAVFFVTKKRLLVSRAKRRRSYIETYGEDGFNEIYRLVMRHYGR